MKRIDLELYYNGTEVDISVLYEMSDTLWDDDIEFEIVKATDKHNKILDIEELSDDAEFMEEVEYELLRKLEDEEGELIEDEED